jgi:hypothetical protein
MYFIPLPCPFLGLLGSDDLGLAALSYQRGEWGKRFTMSCPMISIVLDHAQEPVFDFFGGVIAPVFICCGFMPIYPRYSVSTAHNFDLGALTFQARFLQPGKN